MKYTIIFWQENFSIHQSLLLRTLGANEIVYLVVQNEVNLNRLNDGWFKPNYGDVNVIINPNNQEVDWLLSIENSINIFSGFHSSNFMKKTFEKAIKKSCKIGVQLEPFNTIGVSGKLRYLKYKILKYKYEKNVDFLLTIGDNAQRLYSQIGFNKQKLFDWAYFIEHNNIKSNVQSPSKKVKVLYVGRLDKNKNILKVLPDIIVHDDRIECITIIGNGPLREMINNISKSKINIIDKVVNTEIYKIMAQHDLLILPSLHDGWGAVVSESLCVGTPVLCSDRCGASSLILPFNGLVFTHTGDDFCLKLVSILNKIQTNYYNREKILEWYKKNLSGDSVKNYLFSIFQFTYNNCPEKPTAPWKNPVL